MRWRRPFSDTSCRARVTVADVDDDDDDNLQGPAAQHLTRFWLRDAQGGHQLHGCRRAQCDRDDRLQGPESVHLHHPRREEVIMSTIY